MLCCAGCGNGKYLGVNPQTYKLGSDICLELVTIAASRGHEVAVCDCLTLPYRSNQFDAAICIAVVHHLSTERRRVAALRELMRIVQPGGEALVYVWAMEQERRKVRKSKKLDQHTRFKRKEGWVNRVKHQREQEYIPFRAKVGSTFSFSMQIFGYRCFTFSIVSSTQFDSQDVMVPWHLQPKYREQPPPPPPPCTPSGASEKKMRKQRKKRKKEDKKECANIESGSTKPDDASEVRSDIVEGGFLELSTISLSDKEDSSLQLKTERPQACHRPGQLPDPVFGSNQTSIGQNQTECTQGSIINKGCHYKATDITYTEDRDIVNAHGLDVQNTDCGTGSAETDTASHSSTLVEQGYQTFQRYYHVFREGELSKLFSGLEGVEVLDEFYDHENWCVVAKKKY